MYIWNTLGTTALASAIQIVVHCSPQKANAFVGNNHHHCNQFRPLRTSAASTSQSRLGHRTVGHATVSGESIQPFWVIADRRMRGGSTRHEKNLSWRHRSGDRDRLLAHIKHGLEEEVCMYDESSLQPIHHEIIALDIPPELMYYPELSVLLVVCK